VRCAIFGFETLDEVPEHLHGIRQANRCTPDSSDFIRFVRWGGSSGEVRCGGHGDIEMRPIRIEIIVARSRGSPCSASRAGGCDIDGRMDVAATMSGGLRGRSGRASAKMVSTKIGQAQRRAYEGKSNGSESIAFPCDLLGVFVGDELGKAMGDELPPASMPIRRDECDSAGRDSPRKRGSPPLLGVAGSPTALLATAPRNASLPGASEPRWRAGVPAAEGVPGKNNGPVPEFGAA
jgi:hypothetical protein